jgi:HEAT repeat protein
MATSRKKPAFSGAALAALAHEPARLSDEGARATLVEALASRDVRAVAQAARLIAEHAVAGLEAELVAAYRELRADPGCSAREALLFALDVAEHGDADRFAEAARYQQLEGSKSAPRDTAARVRARGVLGLARLGHRDALPIFGACLGDADPGVRLAAARAIGHRGVRDGAGLLLVRLGAGDAQAQVMHECLHGLFALAPDFAVAQARTMLRSSDARVRDQALHGLGTTPDEGAAELLAEELAACSVPEDRQQIIAALGLSLRPIARALLIELVGGDRPSDAHAALAALSIHRYDTRLVEQLRAATAGSRDLAMELQRLFG